VKAERSPASERVGPHSRAGFESLAADVVESLGGRYSTELGIEVDRNEDEIVEQLVNDSVWLDPKAPGAALPGRKVMSLRPPEYRRSEPGARDARRRGQHR
jgi:hypothetical protein